MATKFTILQNLQNAYKNPPLSVKYLSKGAYATVYTIRTTAGKMVSKQANGPYEMPAAKNEVEKCQSIIQDFIEHKKTCPNTNRAKTCTHPTHHIVKLVNGDNILEQTYKFFRGPTFCKSISKNLSLTIIKQIACQLFEVLQYLKAKKILHLDLSMNNLLLKLGRNDTCKIQLIDFGLAEYSPYSLAILKQTCFCRHPASDFGATLDYTADSWSVGCILFELITGEPLFMFDDNGNQRQKFIALIEHLNGPIPQEWLKSGKNIEAFYIKNPDGTFSFIHPELKPTAKTTKDTFIQERLLKAARIKGYNRNEIMRLSDLITNLVSYTPPTCEEALKELQKSNIPILVDELPGIMQTKNPLLADKTINTHKSPSTFIILTYLKQLFLMIINFFSDCFKSDACVFTYYSEEDDDYSYYSPAPSTVMQKS